MLAGSSLLTMGYSVLLIAASLDRNRSSGGSALLFIFGLILLVLSGTFFTFWFFHWRVTLRAPTEKAD
jgi:hypothetical protein